LSASLQGLGRPKSILKAEFLGLAVTMVSLAILLPAFGIVGAAVSSFLAYSFTTCALIIAMHRIRVQTGIAEQ
jgi:O-antigen/teichoic acid export membrane protein